jgi:hypothetical protein
MTPADPDAARARFAMVVARAVARADAAIEAHFARLSPRRRRRTADEQRRLASSRRGAAVRHGLRPRDDDDEEEEGHEDLALGVDAAADVAVPEVLAHVVAARVALSEVRDAGGDVTIDSTYCV